MWTLIKPLLLVVGLALPACCFGQIVEATVEPPRCANRDLMARAGAGDVLKAYQDYLQQTHTHEIMTPDGPMGILLLTEFVNAQGKACWRLEVCYDDRYKQAVPTGYFFQKSGRFRLIVVYRGNEKGNMLNPDLESSATQQHTLACYEEIVGNRVYIRPPRQPRIARILGRNSDMWVKDRVDISGNVYSALTFVFETDGTFSLISG
ncbi:hypothetical protein [Spirosoma sordidisoli]|uniref:Uncharacterized protein n=1 Tax=Spirosoma sordidisoli TaxID=2502893 RepID=A0A4Q2UIC1_9BACT|nr:hypothetical protein [Spirosoma sordidisoli]RYC69173.1 hypothetical protein EQG79_17400 [Spirosoma sordidisoli]